MNVYVKGNHGTDWHEGMMHNNNTRNSQDMRRSVEGTKDGEITLQNAQAGARRHSQDTRHVSGDMRRVSPDASRAPGSRPVDVHVSQDVRRDPVPRPEEPRARLVEPNVSHDDVAFGIA